MHKVSLLKITIVLLSYKAVTFATLIIRYGCTLNKLKWKQTLHFNLMLFHFKSTVLDCRTNSSTKIPHGPKTQSMDSTGPALYNEEDEQDENIYRGPTSWDLRLVCQMWVQGLNCGHSVMFYSTDGSGSQRGWKLGFNVSGKRPDSAWGDLPHAEFCRKVLSHSIQGQSSGEAEWITSLPEPNAQ